MDITIKRTAHTLYRVDNTLATILLEAFPTRFSRYEKPAPPPDVERFGLVQANSGYWMIQRTFGAELGYFDNYPYLAKTCWPDVPNELVRAYAARFELRAGIHSMTPQAAHAHENFMAKLGK